ncbi:hypothetical protein [Novosphingobium sp. JCM 18896]|uniref:hypothetical protein n=1 Tax=Novosphingobium sp. JCM 18896 TaxID=2989731 RepID=UPI0022233F8A|nr:hypothetical protein [Novosphingobium sp. JCM 18896]MCW1429876.1 hypothetical protein [Novosphingobium sp. JCM 18896]
MTLTLPQLAIAALVVVLIIGLAMVAWRRRKPKGPTLEGVPNPTEVVPAEPTRRRQLQSFVDTEWDTPPEPMPEAVPATQFEPEPEPEPEPEQEPETFTPLAADFAPAPEPFAEPATQPAAEAEPAETEDDAPADYDQAVLGRLEEAFEALQAREITLDNYRKLILAEEDAVDRRVAMLEAEGDSDELQAALVAQESVRWCLDWANDQDEIPPA